MNKFKREVKARKIKPGQIVTGMVSRSTLYNLRRQGIVKFTGLRGWPGEWILTREGYEVTR